MKIFFDATYGADGAVVWRCMDGEVYACFEANGPSSGCDRQIAPKITSQMVRFCIDNPNADVIPAAVAGHNIYWWACSSGRPFLARIPQGGQLDKRHFIADAWQLLNGAAYKRVGVEWFNKGKYDLAVSLFSGAINLDQNDTLAYYDRGNAWLALYDYQKAIVDYSSEIRIVGNNAYSYYRRDLAYEQLGELDKALADFNHVLENAPTDEEARGAAARVSSAITAKSSGPAGPQEIPLISYGGTFVVPVLINETIKLNFTIDSGAADVSIPADVVGTLQRTGTLQQSDFAGEHEYQLADGTTIKSATFNIKSLRVGSIVVENVRGSVSPPSGQLLLGQTFLTRLPRWSIDNERHVLQFQ